jgi:hypothetical protein
METAYNSKNLTGFIFTRRHYVTSRKAIILRPLLCIFVQRFSYDSELWAAFEFREITQDIPLLLTQYALTIFWSSYSDVAEDLPFWDVTPCRLVHSYQHFSDFVALKMTALRAFETSITIYKPRRTNIPEDISFTDSQEHNETQHNYHYCQNCFTHGIWEKLFFNLLACPAV